MPARRSRPALTRRRFLGHLGAVGGSSLVMTAMSSWELMAGAAGQRPALEGRPRAAKVIVIGAGISGLVVGYELGKLGYDFRILEARDRVGGLAWTIRRGSEHTETTGERQVCTFDEGQHFNAAAWRIPYSHTGILNYCKELAVPLQMFVNESDASYFYYEGDGPLANRRVRLREVKADMIGRTNELLVKAIDQRALDLPLTDEDRKRFVDFLVGHGYLDASDRRYKAFEDRGPGDPYAFDALLRSGFASRMRSIPQRDGTQAAPMFHPVGGMDQIPRAFQRAIGSSARHARRRRPVRAPGRPRREGYICQPGSRARTEVAADYVVVCMPFSVLAGVDINLSPDMMAAGAPTTYSTSAKLGLAMKRRFWERGRSDLRRPPLLEPAARRILLPSSDYLSKKGVLLGLYVHAPIGDLADRPVSARVEHVLTHASKVHPQIRAEFESAYAVWWKKVPYSLGASPRARRRRGWRSSRRSTTGSSSARPLRRPTPSPTGRKGAVAAAWQALKSLHARAMQASPA
jgi:monoamine oxidase